MEAFFNKLDKVVQEGWEIIRNGRYWDFCLNNTIPFELYRIVMLQIFHYTKYNSINQGL